jgi:hypothetical protein
VPTNTPSTDDLAIFIKYLRRRRIALFALAGLVMAFDVALTVFMIFFARPDGSVRVESATIAAGAVLATLAVIPLLSALRPHEKHPAIRALADPERIVWIRPTRGLMSGGHVSTTYALCTTTGKRPSLTVTVRDEAAAEALLKRICPHAAFGFDPAWETLFRSDPAGFRSRVG